MIVERIEPQGFCKGVKLALKKCCEAINNPNTKRPIYLLGMIIHNKNVCSALEEKGITILDDSKASKKELLQNINTGTIIVSAHGVSENIYKIIAEKKLDLIDTTCGVVKHIHKEILNKIEKGYEILYIGKRKHPEAQGILDESDKITLLENQEDINSISKSKKYFVANQTTLNNQFVQKFHTLLKQKNNNLLFNNNICNATTIRQKALLNVKGDIIIIVGDLASSNTKELFKIAKQSNEEVILIETLDDLKEINLSKYKKAVVTSGASTPKIITDEVIYYLEHYPKTEPISKITISILFSSILNEK